MKKFQISVINTVSARELKPDEIELVGTYQVELDYPATTDDLAKLTADNLPQLKIQRPQFFEVIAIENGKALLPNETHGPLPMDDELKGKAVRISPAPLEFAFTVQVWALDQDDLYATRTLVGEGVIESFSVTTALAQADFHLGSRVPAAKPHIIIAESGEVIA